MAKMVVEGYCRVCGTFGKMSEEHVPPKAAFNNRPYIEVKFDDTMKLGPEEVPEGPKRQGGVRFRTLCGKCNNDFGGWYARAFVDWCYEGMSILQRSEGNPGLIYAHDVYPMRILKEIIVMFFSVNSEDFRETFVGKELAWLLLNREEKGLPSSVRFYTYFNSTGQLRYNPIVTLGNFEKGIAHVFSEITYPPYGYVMAIGTEPPDSRLFDITHFAKYDWSDTATVRLNLPLLPTYFGTIPGDYRTLEEINKQEQRSRDEEAGIVPTKNVTLSDQVKLLETLNQMVQLENLSQTK